MDPALQFAEQISGYLTARQAMPAIKQANIPEFVRTSPDARTLYRNPVARPEQVVQELAMLAVEQLGRQYQESKDSGIESPFMTTLGSILSTVEIPSKPALHTRMVSGTAGTKGNRAEDYATALVDLIKGDPKAQMLADEFLLLMRQGTEASSTASKSAKK